MVGDSPQLQAAPAMGKFKASRELLGETWRILVSDKIIAVFPFLGGICAVVGAVVILGGGYLIANAGPADNRSIVMAVALFIAWVVDAFAITYFQAGLVTVVNGRLHGEAVTFGQGLSAASRRVGTIFLWALLTATIGIILQAFRSKKNIIGTMIANMVGLIWGVATYFVVPAMIIKGENIRGSIAESVAVMKKTWGEALVANFSIGLIFTVVAIIFAILPVGVLWFGIPSGAISLASTSSVLQLLVGVGAYELLLLLFLVIIVAPLNNILCVVLYNYAMSGQVPDGFRKEVLDRMFVSEQ